MTSSSSPTGTPTRVQGYLDDLSKDLYAPDANPDIIAESKASTDMNKESIDRYGPGDFSQFVDFNEFDGGDGRTFRLSCCRLSSCRAVEL